MNKASRRKALRIGMQTTEMMFAVPQVVSHRLGRVKTSSAGTRARDQREFQLMGAEKFAAFGESWTKMTIQMLKANQQITRAWASAWSTPFRMPTRAAARRSLVRSVAQLQGSALSIVSSGLAPVHRRATANAKRLSRVKT